MRIAKSNIRDSEGRHNAREKDVQRRLSVSIPLWKRMGRMLVWDVGHEQRWSKFENL